jgi:hypothetical protein
MREKMITSLAEIRDLIKRITAKRMWLTHRLKWNMRILNCPMWPNDHAFGDHSAFVCISVISHPTLRLQGEGFSSFPGGILKNNVPVKVGLT